MKLSDINEEILKKIIKRDSNIYRILVDFAKYTEIMYECGEYHKNAFAKYKNYFRGKDVAIIGSGPTLDMWEPFKDCIQMGVNSTFFSKKLNLDFLFFQDYDFNHFMHVKEVLKNRKDIKCNIFIGLHYNSKIEPVPLNEIEALNAKPYFFYEGVQFPEMYPWYFTIDISKKPFIIYYSSIFVALQFAVFTHPKRIFIVGCDCSSEGHCSDNLNSFDLNDPFTSKKCELLKKGWERFNFFVSRLYSDIEIISVNPVGI